MKRRQRLQDAASDEIPLTPVNRGEETDDEHDEHSSDENETPERPSPLKPVPTLQNVDERPASSKDRHAMFLTLTVMSMVFLVLNVVQIGLIFRIRNYYWMAVLPGAILAVFMVFLAFESYRRRTGLMKSWNDATWETRLARVGIVATVFINIFACEFGYLNGEAMSVAKDKVWHTSISTAQSLPPPAMALGQDTFFADRGVLASNATWLNGFYDNHKNAPDITNQRSFNNYSTIKLGNVSIGLPAGNLDYVTFDGNYHNLGLHDDLDLFYAYYIDNENPRPALGFLAFDPKFLEKPGLFKKAMDCGIVVGNLFNALGRTQLSLEQIYINDKVKAIEYTDECNDDEFRDYISYRFTLSNYAGDPNADCAIDGRVPPADPSTDLPCIGDIDIRFSTMLVTNQTSTYRKSWIDMLTDEGGIIGGIMFVTWFMGILSQ